VEVDPKYAKGYYRRGVGKYALARYKEAAKDFRIVLKFAPNDRDAKLKLDDCDKTVARMAFEKAIASNEVVKKVSDSIDTQSIIVEDTYDGVRIDDGKVTKEFVDDMIERFVGQKKIHRRYAYEVACAPDHCLCPRLFYFNVVYASNISWMIRDWGRRRRRNRHRNKDQRHTDTETSA
jgi:serine/threonine-protein phosphatase 5